MGFDVAEIRMSSIDANNQLVTVSAKVVDAGHHARRLIRLTGLDVEENQARRLLNDLDGYRATTAPDEPEEIVAHRWVMQVFEPVIGAIPTELRRKLESAEIFHEVLEHRWFMAEKQRRNVPMEEAVASYIQDVLSKKPDEAAVFGTPAGLDDTMEMSALTD
jgi:CRISPR/Cas system CSM-associated protein Csm2 small subunit